VADPDYIKGTFSVDPASFVDDDGEAYLFFGGLWGGQLQCYQQDDGDTFDPQWLGPKERSGASDVAQGPRVAKLDSSMRALASPTREVNILNPDTGAPIAADDHDKRFFEAAWVHKHQDTYSLSYSTGDSHLLVYATASNPLGPYTYRGRLLEPVLGWTTRHSVVMFEDRWWLFYHDCELSNGVNHLRSVKVKEIKYRDDGSIVSA